MTKACSGFKNTLNKQTQVHLYSAYQATVSTSCCITHLCAVGGAVSPSWSRAEECRCGLCVAGCEVTGGGLQHDGNH